MVRLRSGLGWMLGLVGCLSATGTGISSAPPAAIAGSAGTPPRQTMAQIAPGAIAPTFTTLSRLSGFSADGRHYIHLESSRDTGAGVPTSRLQIVDLTRNRCAPQSCLETRYGEAQAGMSLAQAELELLQKTWALRQSLQLATPQTGKTLPVLSRSRDPVGTEIMTLQRAGQAQPMELRLHQLHRASPGPPDPSGPDEPAVLQDGSVLSLELLQDGQWQQVSVIQRFQQDGLAYSIREVKLSPQGDRLAVLLTVTLTTFEGTLATTLVQGFDL
jgi:predicted secreted protein